MLVHGNNLQQKESRRGKYADEESQRLLAEIREKYNFWHQANMDLIGPGLHSQDDDEEIIAERVRHLNEYKDFIDQQVYAEHFDSRSRLHSTVIEEFLYYLFRDLVSDFGERALMGKSDTFKDLFFVPPNFREMVAKPHARIEIKEHDFIIGVRIEAKMSCRRLTADDLGPLFAASRQSSEDDADYAAETHTFDLPAVAIECKTYLDKTMLEGSSTAAEQLKARNPNAMYIVVMEWIKLTEDVNLQKYKVDQIYVLRRQKSVDREFRFAPDYQKNPNYEDVVCHLFETVRSHLSSDWQGGVQFGLNRGWLL